MNEEELVQAIGNEVCEGCGPNADCGEDPSECVRVATAIGLLDDYVNQQAVSAQQPDTADWDCARREQYKDYYTEDLSLEYHLPCNACVYRNEKIEDTPCLKCVHYVR